MVVLTQSFLPEDLETEVLQITQVQFHIQEFFIKILWRYWHSSIMTISGNIKTLTEGFNYQHNECLFSCKSSCECVSVSGLNRNKAEQSTFFSLERADVCVPYTLFWKLACTCKRYFLKNKQSNVSEGSPSSLHVNRVLFMQYIFNSIFQEYIFAHLCALFIWFLIDFLEQISILKVSTLGKEEEKRKTRAYDFTSDNCIF